MRALGHIPWRGMLERRLAAAGASGQHSMGWAHTCDGHGDHLCIALVDPRHGLVRVQEAPVPGTLRMVQGPKQQLEAGHRKPSGKASARLVSLVASWNTP